MDAVRLTGDRAMHEMKLTLEEALFELVVQKPDAAEREAFLDGVCRDNPALRARLDELLEGHLAGKGFLTKSVGDRESPAAGDAPGDEVLEALLAQYRKGGDFQDNAPLSPEVEAQMAALKPGEAGDRLGRYKLLEKIGEGGFGEVWMAEQREPVKRRVALKIIKLGMDSRQVVARFEAERQALAMMEHPNIAKILDADVTPVGRPYFVMELVRGIKITEYCDQAQLPTEERLRLFILVCQAIQHAHQKGIIHRDIKPSNILVTLHDGVPVPKVIDFGIAKATQQELTELTVFTQFQQFIGTPAYISPEQAEMSGLDIDTRADIYSLGVLLYELLVGQTPFDANEMMKGGIDALRQIIRENEPQRPSTRVNTLSREARTTAGKRRQTEVGKLVHQLQGDLDWIVMKCLEKDRSRRYDTANGLAMDIQRHLANEPVVARPPSVAYKFQKAWQRNKLAFTAGICVALALLVGSGVSLWQAVRATRAEAVARAERDAATQARIEVETMYRFLRVDLLELSTPDASAPEAVRDAMAEVLNRAVKKLDQNADIARQPALEARLRLALGSTYFKLGKLTEAEGQLRGSLAQSLIAFGPNDRETLSAQEALAWLLVGGLRKFDEGEELSFKTWQARRLVLPPEDPDTLDSMDTYASALMHQKRPKEALEIGRACLAARERVLGPTANGTLTSLGNLAMVLQDLGDLAGAERALRDVIERRRSLRLPDTPDSFANPSNLAVTLFLQGRVDEAIATLEEALPRARQSCGPKFPATLHLQHVLARFKFSAGRLEEAEDLARRTLEVRLQSMPLHEGTGRTKLILGSVLVAKGELDEAELQLREALKLFRENYAKKTELSAQAANWLGAIELARREYQKAEDLLVPNIAPILLPEAALSAAEQRTAVGHLVKLYEAWDKPDRKATWQAKLDAIGKAPVNGKREGQ